MTITTCTEGVWKLNDVHKKINAGRWVTYNPSGDPSGMYNSGFESAYGEIGVNTASIGYSSPVQVPGTNWCKVCVGGDQMMAIRSDNSLWAWGRNDKGSLGQNNVVNQSSPVQIPGSWCEISVGQTNTNLINLGIKTDNTLWVWGTNSNGITGTGVKDVTITAYSSPTQIPGTIWCKVSSGTSLHSAIRTDNTLWTWGATVAGGGLGDGLATSIKSSPIQLPGSWCDVTNGQDLGLAIKTDNTLWAWGCNVIGQLGQNNRISRSSPVQIPGSWCKISTYLTSAAYQAVSGIKTDGSLWVWGSNSGGKLGLNNTTNRSSPVQLPGTWSDITVGASSMMAKKSDGSLWVWGSISNGTSFADRSSPVQFPGTEWIDFSVGSNGVSSTIKY